MSDWRQLAECRAVDPALFFFDRGASKFDAQAAKEVCGGCPVRADCLADALANSEQFGVWGGLTVEEREALSPHRRRAPVAQCGTAAGYRRHRRNDEPACAECRAANAAAEWVGKARRKAGRIEVGRNGKDVDVTFTIASRRHLYEEVVA